MKTSVVSIGLIVILAITICLPSIVLSGGLSNLGILEYTVFANNTARIKIRNFGRTREMIETRDIVAVFGNNDTRHGKYVMKDGVWLNPGESAHVFVDFGGRSAYPIVEIHIDY